MQLLRQAIEKWNDHDLAGFAAMHAADAELMMGPMGPPVNRETWTAMGELYLNAFPDNRQEVVRTVDLGDGWVLAEVVFSGTNDAPFFGIPATHRPFQVRAAHLWRYVDGLGVIGNTYWDQLTVNAQLYPPDPEPPSNAGDWELYK